MARWIRCLLRRAERPRTPGREAAASAMRWVESARAESARREPEVARQAAQARSLRERNHFQEAIRAAFLGGGS